MTIESCTFVMPAGRLERLKLYFIGLEWRHSKPPLLSQFWGGALFNLRTQTPTYTGKIPLVPYTGTTKLW